jgi:hypothetical protein
MRCGRFQKPSSAAIIFSAKFLEVCHYRDSGIGTRDPGVRDPFPSRYP